MLHRPVASRARSAAFHVARRLAGACRSQWPHLPLAIAALVLSACSTLQNQTAVDAGPTPTCSGPAECAAKWEAARLFVMHASPNRLQSDTPDYLQTFNTARDSDLSAEVTREPAGPGAYHIVAVFGCRGISFARNCFPEEADLALAQFNQAVNAVQAPAPGAQP